MARSPELRQIGRNLSRIRKARGLTQQQLAEKVNLSVDFVSGVERGVVSPSIASLSRIVSELGASLVDAVARDRDDAKAGFDDVLAALVDLLKREADVADLKFLHTSAEALVEYRAALGRSPSPHGRRES